MVKEEKVHLMTQLALEETRHHKEEIKECGYYKAEYIRFHVLGVVYNVTVSCFLILVLVALYHVDYIFLNVVGLDYLGIGLAFFGIYLGVVIISVIFSYFYYSQKYASNRAVLRRYYDILKKLDDLYSRDGEEAEDDTVTGV